MNYAKYCSHAAQNLQRAYAIQNKLAQHRVQRIYPDVICTEMTKLKLSHAQHIIAREIGFHDWKDLKDHITVYVKIITNTSSGGAEYWDDTDELLYAVQQHFPSNLPYETREDDENKSIGHLSPSKEWYSRWPHFIRSGNKEKDQQNFNRLLDTICTDMPRLHKPMLINEGSTSNSTISYKDRAALNAVHYLSSYAVVEYSHYKDTAELIALTSQGVIESYTEKRNDYHDYYEPFMHTARMCQSATPLMQKNWFDGSQSCVFQVIEHIAIYNEDSGQRGEAFIDLWSVMEPHDIMTLIIDLLRHILQVNKWQCQDLPPEHQDELSAEIILHGRDTYESVLAGGEIPNSTIDWKADDWCFLNDSIFLYCKDSIDDGSLNLTTIEDPLIRNRLYYMIALFE